MQELEILTALKELTKAVEEIRTSQAVASADAKAVRNEVAKIGRIITGDSEPERGFTFRLLKLEEHVLELRNDSKSVRNWAWTAVGAAAIGIGSTIWNKLFT